MQRTLKKQQNEEEEEEGSLFLLHFDSTLTVLLPLLRFMLIYVGSDMGFSLKLFSILDLKCEYKSA